jgi:glycosidase
MNKHHQGIVSFLLFLFVLTGNATAQLRVPEWAQDVVWYQIFPERFRNGDPKNDPTKESLESRFAAEWRVSPWTTDWYEMQPWERQRSSNFYDIVFDRRYGGDMQGVLEKLDYLSELGVTAIYFNPVFDAASLHKYDASTYHHIDAHFGPNPEGDRFLMQQETDDPATWRWTSADSLFLRLLHEAHARGIRIIIDGVFNHSGTRFWAFEDVRKNQQRSKYADWFDVVRWDDPTTPENEFDYKGWWGYKGLPEFREDENGFVQPVWDYFFHITRRWMDPNGDGDPSDGVDGWRLDVANEVSEKFWREWRKHVKSINPDAYIVGEIWDDASRWLAGDMFDATMNYRFARAAVRFFINTDSSRLLPGEFDRELAKIRASYAPEVNEILQNLYDSHDTDRLASMILNPNRDYDRRAGPRDNPDYNVARPGDREWRILRLMALFQMTYVGAPMVYYGTEAGMWGADDPDDRKPMVWPDLVYDAERSHPIPGKSRPVDTVAFDRSLFDYYKQLIRVRRENKALRQGDFMTLVVDDQARVYGFTRTLEENEVVVLLNNSDVQHTVRIPLKGTFRDALNGKVVKGDPTFEVKLPEKSGVVLVKE